MKTNLYIDARFFKNKHDGVSRYITEVIAGLPEKYNIYYYSNKKIILPEKLKKGHFEILECTLFRFIPGTLFVMFILPFCLLNKKGVFIGGAHSVPIFGMKNILIIHDLVAFEYPETMTTIGKILNKFSLYISIPRSTRTVSVSNFTKERLKSILPKYIENKNIEVVPNSVDRTIFNMDMDKNIVVRDIPENILASYLLAVGTIEPRKNIMELIKSYHKLLIDNQYKGKLILVGASGWKNRDIYNYIEINHLENNIIMPGYLSDSEVNYLMNHCDLFVFPSLYEGFGIPPLEAYCSGAKVLTTVYSEMPYLNIDEFVFYDPYKDDLSKKIIYALNKDIQNTNSYKKTWHDSSVILDRVINLIMKNANYG